MFGISGTELFMIVAFALLIFGPDQLPKVGRTVGQMMREFKRAQDTMEAMIRAEVYSDRRPSAGNLSDVEDADVGEDESVTPTREPGVPLIVDGMEPEDEDEEEEE
ncbi:MAG: twin-arginine translocase TatA/TatE family subunit [Coriobacteriia bacterium]|nr:twin-arginine translocase TatA/TatE family subunit [Coriobacteriia bacterium]